MPINGLSTQEAGKFQEHFQLRKGEEKKANAPGKDLGDRFRFVPMDPEDEEMAEAFVGEYGSLEVEQIEVYFPYATREEVFESWCEEYTASQLVHRCDGQHIVRHHPTTGELLVTREPCLYREMPLGDKDRPCKPTGRLHVLLRPLMISLGRGFLGSVITTSLNDIANISTTLESYQGFLKGSLLGVPFDIYRRMRKISTPSGSDGKRARRSKGLIFIDVSPMVSQAALQAQTPVFLLENGVTVETEEPPISEENVETSAEAVENDQQSNGHYESEVESDKEKEIRDDGGVDEPLPEEGEEEAQGGPPAQTMTPHLVAFIEKTQQAKAVIGEEAYYDILGGFGYEHGNQVELKHRETVKKTLEEEARSKEAKPK